MAWARSDIHTWLSDQNKSDSSARAIRNYDRMANDANRALHGCGDWRFDRTFQRVLYEAAKTSGTVSVSSDGTTVTGSGTSFDTSAPQSDIGKYFRFNGEAHKYLCSAVGSTTSATIEAYRGASNLSAVTYALTHDREDVDARTRKLALPDGDDDNMQLEPITMDEMKWQHLHGREVGVPWACALEDYSSSTTGAAPALYLWVYPSPQNREIFDIPTYLWPVEIDGTGTAGISAPKEADSPYREFLQWQVLLYKGKAQEAENQLALAIRMARQNLAAFRAQSEGGCREPWTPNGDPFWPTARKRRSRPAPGEPVYQ